MPRRGSILDSRSDRSTSRSDRSTSSKSFQTTSRYNNKGSTFHQPVYQNANEYYIPTLGSTHPPQHDYGRVDAYQYCEGFRFQDLLQTQGGFSQDNQLVYGGHNLYRSCCDVAVAQINYPSFKHNTQDSIEQARGRSHEEDSSQIFMLDDMQLGGFGRYLG